MTYQLSIGQPQSGKSWTNIQSLRSIFDEKNYLIHQPSVVLFEGLDEENVKVLNTMSMRDWGYQFSVHLKRLEFVPQGAGTVGEAGMYDIVVYVENIDVVRNRCIRVFDYCRGVGAREIWEPFLYIGSMWVEDSVVLQGTKDFLVEEFKSVRYPVDKLLVMNNKETIGTFLLNELEEGDDVVGEEKDRLQKKIFPNMKPSGVFQEVVKSVIKWLKKTFKKRNDQLPKSIPGLLRAIEPFCTRKTRVIHPETILEEFSNLGFLVFDEDIKLLFEFTEKEIEYSLKEFLQLKEMQKYKIIQRTVIYESLEWVTKIRNTRKTSDMLYSDTFLNMIEQQCCEVKTEIDPQTVVNHLVKKGIIKVDERGEFDIVYLLGEKMTIKFGDVGPYSEFSTSYPSLFTYGGKKYKTVDHFLYCARLKSSYFQDLVRASPTVEEAKGICFSREDTWYDDWEETIQGNLRDALEEKFQDPKMKSLLMETRPHKLVYEGVNIESIDRILGDILMEIRD
eukprot:TRINITY_DN3719_c0_g1_i1.p1 TRINITY_DN3719_c0_g1~~TRINITY_DN3719_c0_g1_i1.p1  ORF type:complete len:524 (-),score=106.24 TRINITY_DN3719_c0_g1_i1:101-1615(-)